MSRETPLRLLVFAGMPRTGTTSLYHILRKHPSIFAPYRKEIGYFLQNFHRGPDWYRGAFRGIEASQLGIDVTPEYFFSTEAARRLRDFEPTPRVVIGVRDPCQVAVSLYREYSRFLDMPPFQDFVQSFEYARGSSTIRLALARGSISKMIEAYKNALGDNLLLFDYAVFVQRPLFVLQAIERFAGVDSYFQESTFENVFFNARDRRSWGGFYRLIAGAGFLGALERLLPRRAAMSLAHAFYSLSSRPRASPSGGAAEADRLDPLPDALLAEREAMRELFRESPIVLGSGASSWA